MKYLREYRNATSIRKFLDIITTRITRPWTIMEICGGQTHTILKFGLNQAFPPMLQLIHGPGCPVCVTPAAKIDTAIAIAHHHGCILCSFGDMLRVPGSTASLLQAKTEGADVRVVYSPLDALELARSNPDRQVVFFAVGFETTAPANAMAVYHAAQLGYKNFSVLVSHVLVPPAIEAILANPRCNIAGFLAAGHVCTVMGMGEYRPLAQRYTLPIVVTGFEPVDILEGICRCVSMLEDGESGVYNQYCRSVKEAGNRAARTMLEDVFTVIDMEWRGLGWIPASGFALAPRYHFFDAERRFAHTHPHAPHDIPDNGCQAGAVLQGLLKPSQCPHFMRTCTPSSPLGAPMVSGEGACAAYAHYMGRN